MIQNKIPNVLIVATSRKTRGGITSVVSSHGLGEQWGKYNCKWIETHIDKNFAIKLLYFLKSFLQYLIILPNYDLVHIHTSEPPSAIRKTPYLWYARIWRKKIIVHFHAFSPQTTIYSKYKPIYSYLFSNADKILVLSEYWKREIDISFGLGKKTTVLYNPSAAPEYSKYYIRRKHILYAGTVNARKGYEDLIKAFAEIAKKYPEWRLTIAGNGEIEKGKQLAKDLRIEQQIEFLGWINGEEKSKAFQQASIFCLPSYAEGFPMAVLDAWAYGLPVITTPVGGLPDVLIDNENSLIFTPGDIKGLSAALERFILNKKLRENISIESKKLSNETFNSKVINKQLGFIYDKLIGYEI